MAPRILVLTCRDEIISKKAKDYADLKTLCSFIEVRFRLLKGFYNLMYEIFNEENEYVLNDVGTDSDFNDIVKNFNREELRLSIFPNISRQLESSVMKREITDLLQAFRKQVVNSPNFLQDICLRCIDDPKAVSILIEFLNEPEYSLICEDFLVGIREGKSLQQLFYQACGRSQFFSLMDKINVKFSHLFQKSIQHKNNDRDPKPHHYSIKCDGCGTCPLIGTRYKSIKVEDFDLCETCESSEKWEESHSPFVKIRSENLDLNWKLLDDTSVDVTTEPTDTTSQPTDLEICSEETVKVTEPTTLLSETLEPCIVQVQQHDLPQDSEKVVIQNDTIDEESKNDNIQESNLIQHTLKGKLSKCDAIFLEDVSYQDGTIVCPGEKIYKYWRIQTIGLSAYSGVVHVQGSNFHFIDSASEEQLKLKETDEVLVALYLEMPMEPGRYVGYWRLKGQDGLPLGDVFWIDVVVDVPKEEIQVGAVVTEVVENSEPISEGKSEKQNEVNEQANQNQRQEEFVLVNNEQAAENTLYKDVLLQVEQMGFRDKELNKQLAIKHGGAIELILDNLLILS